MQSIANLVNTYNGGIEYSIFCGSTDLNGETPAGIIPDQWVPYNKHTTVWYASENITKSLEVQAAVIKPDIIYIIGLFSWHYNIVPLFFCKAQKKILSVRGMLHPGALSQKRLKKIIFLQALKFSGLHKKIIFHATDETEASHIKEYFGSTVKVNIAGNFSKTVKLTKHSIKEEGFLKLITVALISPMKNHLQVLYALSKCIGQIEYNIYGPVKDKLYWEQCLEQIKKLPPNINVQYQGELAPALLEETLSQHHVFIMPSKSENFGHALYEALSSGLPVITSHNTPWNGLQKKAAGINTSPDSQEISNAINLFSEMNNEQYSRFAEGAIIYAKENLDAKKTEAQYMEMFNLKSSIKNIQS